MLITPCVSLQLKAALLAVSASPHFFSALRAGDKQRHAAVAAKLRALGVALSAFRAYVFLVGFRSVGNGSHRRPYLRTRLVYHGQRLILYIFGELSSQSEQ